MRISEGISSYYHKDIEEYRGRNDPEAIKAVAKEMEALFAYEMIKAMRETTNMSSKESLGKDIYMSLFDTELARLLTERGLGLKDMLRKELNRAYTKTKNISDNTDTKGEVKDQAEKSFSTKPVRAPEQQNYLLSPEKISPKFTETHEEQSYSLPVDGIISSPFGMRKHPIYGDSRFHQGVDIAAPEGTQVHPVRHGKVIFSGEQSGYGNVVIIDHGNGLISKYGHNKVNLVREGEDVDTDTVIALVGSTGKSTGPHLHFEVRYEGESTDPVKLIAMR
jgi:murein DD-endopeptidase MepM/ murein hydrolase activator NlpD